MRIEITKEWLDLAFSSNGRLSLHVDDIRQFLIKRLETTTNDNEIADRLRLLRNWGSKIKYQHEIKGFNSRLDTLQAVILNVKLRRLAEWNDCRIRAAHWYRERHMKKNRNRPR